jgi:SAM-dependent MidA family methyltransferase
MELALYAPGLGYYVAGATKLGSDGDFVTAPELSPLFGRTLARQIAELLERTGGDALELGAGSGMMAADVLGELHNIDCLPRRYLILETSPQLAQHQRETLQRRQPALMGRLEWISAVPETFDGAIVANEVLDALPVHLVAWRQNGTFERGVGWKDGFVWSERPLPPGALYDTAQAIGAQAGYVSEISLLAPALVSTLSAALHKGAILLIDYGFGRREYYHPQRTRGTLMCHYRHRTHDDPFFLPGLQDLTAHVDFTAIAEAGIDSGLTLLGYTTQAQFLVNCGITGLLEQHSHDAPAARIALTGGAQKLLSPAEMGELFKVITLGRGIDGPLLGFASGDKSRLL